MYRVEIENDGVTEVIHALSPDSALRLLRGTFTEEVNVIPTAALTLPPDAPAYERLHERTTLARIINTLTGETEFDGYVLDIPKNGMDAAGKLEKQISCEGCMGYLCDTVQLYHHYENTQVNVFIGQLLGYHNTLVPAHKRIYLGQCDVTGTASKTTAYRTTLDEIKENLLSRLGGEIRVRRADGVLYLDYLRQYGSQSSTRVELARNIVDLHTASDSSGIITRLIPLGAQLGDETAERLTLQGYAGTDGKPYMDDAAAAAVYGVIVGTVTFDDITLQKNLYTAGRTWLENNNRIKRSYRATVLDLSTIGEASGSFRAGNTYRFRHSLLGLDEPLRILKRTVDIYAPYKPVIEIGDKAERITGLAARTQHYLDYELPQQKLDTLQAARDNATRQITAATHGHVVTEAEEILIMDTGDKRTASKIWRFNLGGFGYSRAGYDGPYETAITMDGAIVADFITAGVLTGIEINNGTGTFHVDPDGTVQASALHITGGSIHITTQADDYDVIELHYNAASCAVSPLQWVLENTDIGAKILCQAGSMYFYIDSEIRATIGADGKIITSGEIWTPDIHFQRDGAYYSLEDTIKYILARLDA